MSTRNKEFLDTFGKFDFITPEFCKYLEDCGFFTQVASTRFHGAYEGGLYDHSKNVMDTLLKYTKNENLNWSRKESPYIIGMFHDLCKADNYYKNETGLYKVNYEKRNLGHGDRSVELLSKYIELTSEEIACINFHMGAYETNRWNEFDKAIKSFPNVLWTHMADMYASKIIEEMGDINEKNPTKNVSCH